MLIIASSSRIAVLKARILIGHRYNVSKNHHFTEVDMLSVIHTFISGNMDDAITDALDKEHKQAWKTYTARNRMRRMLPPYMIG